MPMNDLEAILFDLDGVIIDSEPCTKKPTPTYFCCSASND